MQAPEGHVNYTAFSLWDTFRALHPLMTIIDQEKTREWVTSLLKKYEEGGVSRHYSGICFTSFFFKLTLRKLIPYKLQH